MIQLDHISKAFLSQQVLDQVSLTIEDQEFVSLVGRSGSGKTTLLNIMGLLEKPDAGQVRLGGKTYTKARDILLFHRHEAGFLFQNFALIEAKTVQDNLQIATRYQPAKAKDQAVRTIDQALKKVQLPLDFKKKKIYQLSGGEQQRVALARLLLKNPRYVFADEPTGNLDPDNRDLVFDLLGLLQDLGKTIVLVTHDLDLAQKTDRIIHLADL